MADNFLFRTLGGLLGDTVSYISPALGSVLDSWVKEAEKEDNIKSQKKLIKWQMDLQNQYNIDAFNRENAYNTPLNQRARMEQAGLNPNWSNGFQPVVAQQDSNVQSTPLSLSDIINMMTNKKNSDSNIALNESQIKLNQKQEEVAESQARKTDAEAKSKEIENQNKQREYDDNHNYLVQQTNNLLEQIKVIQAQEAYLKAQKEYQDIVNNNYVRQIEAEIDKLIAEGKLAEAKEVTERKLLPYIEREYDANIAKAYAEVYKSKQEVAQGWKALQLREVEIDNNYKIAKLNYNLATNKAIFENYCNYELGNLYEKQGNKVDQERIGQKIYNSFHKWMLTSDAWILDYNNTYKAMQYIDKQIDNAVKDGRLKDKQDSWYFVEHVLIPGVNTFMKAGGSLSIPE